MPSGVWLVNCSFTEGLRPSNMALAFRSETRRTQDQGAEGVGVTAMTTSCMSVLGAADMVAVVVVVVWVVELLLN